MVLSFRNKIVPLQRLSTFKVVMIENIFGSAVKNHHLENREPSTIKSLCNRAQTFPLIVRACGELLTAWE